MCGRLRLPVIPEPREHLAHLSLPEQDRPANAQRGQILSGKFLYLSGERQGILRCRAERDLAVIGQQTGAALVQGIDGVCSKLR